MGATQAEAAGDAAGCLSHLRQGSKLGRHQPCPPTRQTTSPHTQKPCSPRLLPPASPAPLAGSPAAAPAPCAPPAPAATGGGPPIGESSGEATCSKGRQKQIPVHDSWAKKCDMTLACYSLRFADSKTNKTKALEKQRVGLPLCSPAAAHRLQAWLHSAPPPPDHRCSTFAAAGLSTISRQKACSMRNLKRQI